jgi:hypothetical protein
MRNVNAAAEPADKASGYGTHALPPPDATEAFAARLMRWTALGVVLPVPTMLAAPSIETALDPEPLLIAGRQQERSMFSGVLPGAGCRRVGYA